MNDSEGFYLPAHLTSSSDSEPVLVKKPTRRVRGKSRQSKMLTSLRPWEDTAKSDVFLPAGKLDLHRSQQPDKQPVMPEKHKAKLERGLCKYWPKCHRTAGDCRFYHPDILTGSFVMEHKWLPKDAAQSVPDLFQGPRAKTDIAAPDAQKHQDDTALRDKRSRSGLPEIAVPVTKSPEKEAAIRQTFGSPPRALQLVATAPEEPPANMVFPTSPTSSSSEQHSPQRRTSSAGLKTRVLSVDKPMPVIRASQKTADIALPNNVTVAAALSFIFSVWHSFVSILYMHHMPALPVFSAVKIFPLLADHLPPVVAGALWDALWLVWAYVVHGKDLPVLLRDRWRVATLFALAVGFRWSIAVSLPTSLRLTLSTIVLYASSPTCPLHPGAGLSLLLLTTVAVIGPSGHIGSAVMEAVIVLVSLCVLCLSHQPNIPRTSPVRSEHSVAQGAQ